MVKCGSLCNKTAGTFVAGIPGRCVRAGFWFFLRLMGCNFRVGRVYTFFLSSVCELDSPPLLLRHCSIKYINLKLELLLWRLKLDCSGKLLELEGVEAVSFLPFCLTKWNKRVNFEKKLPSSSFTKEPLFFTLRSYNKPSPFCPLFGG